MAIAACVTLVYFAGFAPANSPAATPIIVQPCKNVNERLFLVQAVARMYSDCLAVGSHPVRFKDEARSLRPIALRLLKHIYNQGLGRKLAALYRGYLKNMDALEDYQDRIAAASSDAGSMRDQAATRGFVSSFATGFAAGGVMNAHPAVAIGSLLYGIYTAYTSEANSDRKISDDERAAFDAARRDLRDQLQPSLLHAHGIVGELARKYGWPAGSAGFDIGRSGTEGNPGGVNPLATLENVADELQAFSGENSVPDSFAANAFIRLLNNAWAPTRHLLPEYPGAPAQLAWCSVYISQCLRAAEMVPPGPAFRAFRSKALRLAFAAARLARSAEQRLGIAPYGSTAISRLAVYLARINIARQPANLRLQWGYFEALMADGQTNAALSVSAPLYPDTALGGDADFCFDYACLCSRIGDYKHAREWLKAALSGGFSRPWWAFEDTDLAPLRKASPKKFDAIAYPSAAYSINPGWVSGDDAVLTKSRLRCIRPVD